MKIDSVIIIKNEEKNIEKLINQFLEYSNEIHITDTGSTDNTLEIIQKYVQEYKNVFLHHFIWINDFGAARNYCMTCYDCHADYQFWCDADDYMNDKLIETLKKFSNEDNLNDDIYYIKYKITGNRFINRQSLLRVNAHLKWYDPIHEYIRVYTTNTQNLTYFDNGSNLIHNPSNTYNHCERNLNIFLNMEKNNYKFTKRNLYYFGRELSNNKLYEKSKEIFKKCIDKNDEKNLMHELNSCINLFKLNDDESIDYFNKLLKNNNYRKDLFFRAGDYFFKRKQYDLAKLYLIMASNCKEPDDKHIMFYDKLTQTNIDNKLKEIENLKK